MLLSSTNQLTYTPSRIISVVPSQTELLYDLGLDSSVIGITKFCIHPDEWFRNKTRIGGTKKLNIQQIRDLQPDLIIANKEENVEEQIMLLAQDIPVWLTDVNNIEDALQMIRDIGTLTNTDQKATSIAKEIEDRFLSIRHLMDVNEKKRTAYLIWREPYMTIGVDTFINNMLQFAGLTNIFADKTRYPEVTVDEIRAANCEVLLLSSEPYPFKQQHIDELQRNLPGVKIKLVDGEMFSWYGSRLLKTPEYLASMMKDL